MSPRCRVCGFPKDDHGDGGACPTAYRYSDSCDEDVPCAWSLSLAHRFSPFTVPPPENRAATWAVHNDTRGFYARDPSGATYAMSEERAKSCADAWSQPSYGPDAWTAVPIRLDERDAEVRRLREALEDAVVIMGWAATRLDDASHAPLAREVREALRDAARKARSALERKG